MGIKREIKRLCKLKTIYWYMDLLKAEYTTPYDLSILDRNVMYENSQKYAKMLCEILEYYKSRNLLVCDAVIKFISKYGEVESRRDPKQTCRHESWVVRSELFSESFNVDVMKLTMSQEGKDVVEKVYSKMIAAQKSEQTNIIDKLAEFTK